MTTTDPRLIDSLLELDPPRRVYAGRHRLGSAPNWEIPSAVLARVLVNDAVYRRRRDRRMTRSWRHW